MVNLELAFQLLLSLLSALPRCGSPNQVLLVVGFALLAEKDEWLNRQVLQALLLTIGYYIATLVTGWVFGGLAQFFGWAGIFRSVSAMNTVNTFVGGILYIALVVFAVLAVLRVLHGKDTQLPFIAKIASGCFTAALQKSPKPETTPPQQVDVRASGTCAFPSYL